MRSGVEIPPLTVLYQPVVDLDTGRVVGAEALSRFRGADGTLMSPAQDGLIDRIEKDPAAVEHLMHGVLEAIATEAVPLFDSRSDFYIGVNVPPNLLGSGILRGILEQLGLVPYLGRLMVEVTERQALTDLGRAALAVSRSMGVRVAVDDFGTGQSGLRQLMGLDFDVLKIDRSQIQPLLTDRTARRLLRGLVALGGALRVRLTAEGIETREQALFLHALGVDCGQGWYWSKALSVEAFAIVLDAGFADSVRWRSGPADHSSAGASTDASTDATSGCRTHSIGSGARRSP